MGALTINPVAGAFSCAPKLQIVHRTAWRFRSRRPEKKARFDLMDIPLTSKKRSADMKVYHRTSSLIADAILAAGFIDKKTLHGTYEPRSGVWMSDVPPDCDESWNAVLVLDMPDEVFAEYEWVEKAKPYREALVPASVLNRYAPPKVYRTAA